MTTDRMRAQQFAEHLRADAEALANDLEGIDEAQWQTITPDEGWPLKITLDDIDGANAKNAAREVARTPESAIAHLRRASTTVADGVAALSEADLERSGQFLLMDGREASVALMAGRIMPGHFGRHAASIRAASNLTAKGEARA